METKFNFKSAICTSREQSERLLTLGLKPETADMVLCEPFDYEKHKYSDGYVKIVLEEGEGFCKEDIPAWSLHRLIEMMPKGDIAVYDEYYREGKFPMWWHIEFDNWKVWLHDEYECTKVFRESPHLFGNIISCIEWLIKEGYFNKEYLV